jgi:hypothetical protein
VCLYLCLHGHRDFYCAGHTLAIDNVVHTVSSIVCLFLIFNLFFSFYILVLSILFGSVCLNQMKNGMEKAFAVNNKKYFFENIFFSFFFTRKENKKIFEISLEFSISTISMENIGQEFNCESNFLAILLWHKKPAHSLCV